MNTKKNYYIELLRFIFCILILLHHSGLVSPDGSGLIPSAGVLGDAFFIITGYFACKHVVSMGDRPKSPAKYSINYTVKKLVRVLPYSTFGVLIVYLLEFIHLTSFSVRDILGRLYTMVVEILLLPMLGIMEVNLITIRNAPLWYLSATLIALPFVIYLSLKIPKIFSRVLVWIVPFALEIWMVKTYGGALPWLDRAFFIYSGAIRGFSSIMLGCAVYYVSDKLSEVISEEKRTLQVLLTIIEGIIFAVVLYNVCKGIGGYTETLTIYMVAVMLALTFSGRTLTSRLQCEKFGILGAISLPVYCIHWGIYRWVGTYLRMLPYWLSIVVTILLCIIAAFVLMELVKRISKKSR